MKFVEIIFVTLLRVIDGDTISVDVNNCPIDLLCRKQEIRLAGIDTSELHSACQKGKELALAAKKMVQEAYPVGSVIVLSNPKLDKYGRILAELPPITKKLLDAGLAIPYNGQKKTFDWCK